MDVAEFVGLLDAQSDLLRPEVGEGDVGHVVTYGTVPEDGDLVLPAEDSLLHGLRGLLLRGEDVAALERLLGFGSEGLAHRFQGILVFLLGIDSYACLLPECPLLLHRFGVGVAVPAPGTEGLRSADGTSPRSHVGMEEPVLALVDFGIGLLEDLDCGQGVPAHVFVVLQGHEALDHGGTRPFLRLLGPSHPGTDAGHNPGTDQVSGRLADGIEGILALQFGYLRESAALLLQAEAVDHGAGEHAVDVYLAVPDPVGGVQVLEDAFADGFEGQDDVSVRHFGVGREELAQSDDPSELHLVPEQIELRMQCDIELLAHL